jgi:hypothetical protein
VASTWRALTPELDDTSSPIRLFLAEHFSAGLREVQRRYRNAAPRDLIIAPVDGVNAGTIGAAADYLLRFLVHPEPDLDLVAGAAARAGDLGIRITRPVLDHILAPTGIKMPLQPAASSQTFTGPCPGNPADPGDLNRICWVLALITETYRAGPAILAGPLGRFRGQAPTSGQLLGLVPAGALDQLTSFRQLYQSVLIPALESRQGLWSDGPVFDGSALIGGADADLIAADLLLELKTEKALPSLGVLTLFQMIGYLLLDFSDKFRITDLGLYRARYGYLATWNAVDLLAELAGRPVDLTELRAEFRQLLSA